METLELANHWLEIARSRFSVAPFHLATGLIAFGFATWIGARLARDAPLVRFIWLVGGTLLGFTYPLAVVGAVFMALLGIHRGRAENATKTDDDVIDVQFKVVEVNDATSSR